MCLEERNTLSRGRPPPAALMVRLIRAGVRRKDGRYATAVLHLLHPDFDRSRLPDNERRLADVVQGDRVRALRGLSALAA